MKPTYGYGFEVGWAASGIVAWLMGAVFAALGLPWYSYVGMAVVALILGTFKTMREVRREPQQEA